MRWMMPIAAARRVMALSPAPSEPWYERARLPTEIHDIPFSPTHTASAEHGSSITQASGRGSAR